MNLFLNPNLSPRGSLVISQTNPTAIPPPDFVFENTRQTNIYIVNGSGGYDVNSGNANYSLRVSIGLPGTELDWVNTNWTPIANGWNGVISTDTTAIEALFTTLGTNPLNCELEITIFDLAGEPVTTLITPIKIWNRVASDDDLVTPPAVNNADGEFSIPSGVDTVLVTGLALSAVPRRVIASVRKVIGADQVQASIVTGSITTDGFRADLTASTGAFSTYKLDYYLIF